MTYTTYDDFIKDTPCVMKAINNSNACKLMRCNTTANTKSVIYFEGVSFSYTGCDQQFQIPATATYCFVVCGAGAYRGTGGCSSGYKGLTYGDTLSVMVGQSGQATQSGTYGFGGTGRLGGRSGGGLTGFFTGASEILSSDSARAIIIGGGAGGGGGDGDAGGSGGGTNGGAGGSSDYGTRGDGGTQTGRGGSGNKASCDTPFLGGNGGGNYGSGGGGGWRGGNGAQGDGSSDDDKGAGGGSGYICGVRCGETCNGRGAGGGNNGNALIKIIGIYDISLLSYEEIIALTSADAVNVELNADPTRYYNALDGGSHISTIDGNNYIVDDQGNKIVWAQSGGILADGNYAFYFDNGSWTAEKQIPPLLEYEEIIAAATSQNINNLIAELNQNPVEYYNMLLADNHLFEPGYHTGFALGYKDQNNNWLYYDYIDGTYSTYDGKSMGDMDINSIIYNPTTNTRSTFYKEG